MGISAVIWTAYPSFIWFHLKLFMWTILFIFVFIFMFCLCAVSCLVLSKGFKPFLWPLGFASLFLCLKPFSCKIFKTKISSDNFISCYKVISFQLVCPILFYLHVLSRCEKGTLLVTQQGALGSCWLLLYFLYMGDIVILVQETWNLEKLDVVYAFFKERWYSKIPFLGE